MVGESGHSQSLGCLNTCPGPVQPHVLHMVCGTNWELPLLWDIQGRDALLLPGPQDRDALGILKCDLVLM